jgi:hypothetical protein
VRHPKIDVPHELHDGDIVTTGDRIHVIVTTSEDAYLYMAYCSNHQLAIYPSRRGVRTRAGSPADIPEHGGGWSSMGIRDPKSCT